MGVSPDAILLSITLALLHAGLEAVFLAMEAQASKTSFSNYCMVCFNGRFGWVPYNDYLVSKSQESDNITSVELDYERIVSKICCFEIEVEFRFSNDSLISLSKTLSSFPSIENKKKRPLIRFGSTVDQVNLDILMNLEQVCQGKINIDLNGTDFEPIIMKSKYATLLQSSDEFQEQDRENLFMLQKQKIHLLLNFLLNRNENLLKVVNPNDSMTLAQTALDQRDKELLILLLNLNSEVFKNQLGEVENDQTLTWRFLATLDFDIWTIFATNSTIFNNANDSYFLMCLQECQQSRTNVFANAQKFCHARYGPNLCKEIINCWEEGYTNDFTEQWIYLYPKRLYVTDGSNYTDVSIKSAYCFAKIRNKLVYQWEIDNKGPNFNQKNSKGTESYPLDISDIGISLQDFKIVSMLLSDEEHEQVLNLTEEQVERLDKCTKTLQMDSHKWLYIGRSRLNDETGRQITATFHGKDPGSKNLKPKRKLSIDRRFDYFSLDTRQFGYCLDITLPETINCITSFNFETEFTDQRDSWFINYIYEKDFSYQTNLAMYPTNLSYKLDGDPSKLANFDQKSRLEKYGDIRPYLQVDALGPGSRCQLMAGDVSSTFNYLKMKMSFDYPISVDLEEEAIKLEAYCQKINDQKKE